MPLDTTESIAAAFRELPIFQAVQALVAAMPPVTPARPRVALDYAPFVGAKPGTVIYKILSETTKPGKKLADVIDILELDPAAPFGQQLLAIDLLIADIKD